MDQNNDSINFAVAADEVLILLIVITLKNLKS